MPIEQVPVMRQITDLCYVAESWPASPSYATGMLENYTDGPPPKRVALCIAVHEYISANVHSLPFVK